MLSAKPNNVGFSLNICENKSDYSAVKKFVGGKFQKKKKLLNFVQFVRTAKFLRDIKRLLGQNDMLYQINTRLPGHCISDRSNKPNWAF